MPKLKYNLDTRELTIEGVLLIWSFFDVEFSGLSKIGAGVNDISIMLPMRDGVNPSTGMLVVSDDTVSGTIDSHCIELIGRYGGDTGSRLVDICLMRGDERIHTVKFRLFGNADAPTLSALLAQSSNIDQPQLPGLASLQALRALNTGEQTRYKDKIQIFIEDVNCNFAFDREDTTSIDDDSTIIVPTDGVGCWKRVGGSGGTTGPVTISDVTGLSLALSGKASTTDLNALTLVVNDKAGIAALSLKADSSALTTLAATVSGKADSSALVLKADASVVSELITTVNGKADASTLATKADLVDGLIPANQLPGYVDDVIEVTDDAALPVTGEAGKIYVVLDSNKQKRWSGTVYVTLTGDLALGETQQTAYRGDHGKAAYDHSQATGNVHSVTAGDVGNGTAQWNANKINGISTSVATVINQALVFDGTNYLPKKVRVDELITATLTSGQQNIIPLGTATAYKVWAIVTDANGNYMSHNLEITSNGTTNKVTAGQGNSDGVISNYSLSCITADIFGGNQRIIFTPTAGVDCTLKYKIINEM